MTDAVQLPDQQSKPLIWIRHPLVLAIASAFVFMAIVLTLFSSRYEDNDDPVMQMIVSGAMTGAPAPDMVFTSRLIGHALNMCYRSGEGWGDWYAMYLYGVHFLAAVGILYAFIRRGPPFLGWLQGIFVLVVFQLRALLLLQFTTTAFMVGFAGILLLLSARGTAGWRTLYGGGALLLCGLIRQDVLWMVVLLATPLVLGCWGLVPCKRWLILVVAIGAGVLAMDAIPTRSAAEMSAWSAFGQYNRVRHRVYDSPHFKPGVMSRSDLTAAQWSLNDYRLFLAGFQETSREILTRKVESLLAVHKIPFWQRIRIACNQVSSKLLEAYRWVILSVLLMIACLLVNGNRRERLTVVAVVITALGILAGLSCHYEIKLRVVLPCLMAVVVACLWVLDARTKVEVPYWLKSVGWLAFSVVMVLGLGGAIFTGVSRSRATQQEIAVMDDLMRFLKPWNDNILVIWSEMSPPLQNVTPVRPQYMSHRGGVYVVGWPSHSPLNKGIVERQGKGELMPVMNGSGVFRLVLTEKDHLISLDLLQKLYAEHYNQKVAIECQGVGAGARVYSILPAGR